MSGTEPPNSSRPDASAATIADPTAAQKLAAELLSTDEFSQYLLKTKSEMFAVFRGMVEHVSQITMFFNEGRDMVLTDMISYSDGGVYLDLGASPEMNQKALEADKLFCVTQLDKVKVQFILRGLKRVDWNGGPAFLAALPDSVLRLQRREYFRLTAANPHNLSCLIPIIVDGEKRMISVEAAVLDISGGGLAVLVPPTETAFEPDMEFADCRLMLPEIGPIATSLRVRNLFRITNRDGSAMPCWPAGR